MRISRLLCEFGVRKNLRDRRDAVGEDVGILPSLWSVKPCTTNRAFLEPSSLNVTSQRIFINAEGESP